MPATLTIDGFNGNDRILTDTVFTGVTSFTVDVDKQLISFIRPDITNSVTTIAIPVIAAAGFTVTAVGNKVATVGISNT